jgi:hypothetical protein
MSHDPLAERSPLRLVKESKIYALLPGGSLNDRLEASGVCLKDGYFIVVFDNSPHIARLGMDLDPHNPANALLRQRGQSAGFEDVTYHATEHRFIIIIEAQLYSEGIYKPRIEEYDDDFRYLDAAWMDFPLARDNKGIEGLTYVQREGQHYLLGLCEGNRCRGGRAGRRGGGGRILLFQRGSAQWDRVGKIKLPKSVLFEDYAALDVQERRIAVVSQMSSALWVGTFTEGSWDFVDEGRIYAFPRNEKGKERYGNIEGVCWVSPSRLVFVSDRRKAGEQPRRVEEKDQSIHIFDLPEEE